MSFIDHLFESEQHDNVVAAMDKMGLHLVDRDMGNVYVVRDTAMGELTGHTDHLFDVRIHGNGVEVHAHDERDAGRAKAIRHALADAHIGALVEESEEDPRRAKAMAYLKSQAEMNKKHDASRAKWRKAHEEKMEKEHGPNWKKVKAEKDEAERRERNDRIMRQNEERKAKHAKMKKEMTPAEWKEYTAKLDRQADSYAGRRKGSNWTGD